MCFSHFAGLSQLTVRISTGTVLTVSDPLRGLPDPYVQVTATDCNGMSQAIQTTTKDDTRNPIWNEDLNFGVNCWLRFVIRLYDEDIGFDDLAGESMVVGNFSSTIQRSSTLCADRGTLCNGTECTTCNSTVEFSYSNIVSSTYSSHSCIVILGKCEQAPQTYNWHMTTSVHSMHKSGICNIMYEVLYFQTSY